MFTYLLTFIHVLILHFPFFLHSSCFYRFHTHVIKYKTKQKTCQSTWTTLHQQSLQYPPPIFIINITDVVPFPSPISSPSQFFSHPNEHPILSTSRPHQHSIPPINICFRSTSTFPSIYDLNLLFGRF